MKAAVPTIGVARATVGSLAIGQLAVGPIHINRLSVQDAAIAVRSGSAQLRGVALSIQLDFQLEWQVGIDVGPIDFSTGGTNDLGGVTIPFPAIDVDIPGLRDINLDIAALVGQNVQVSADTVAGVAVTDVVADGVRASGVTLPTQDVTITGIGLTGIAIEDVGVPAATIATAAVDRVHGAPLTLDQLSLHDLTLPQAAASDVTSTGFEVPFTLPGDGAIRLPGVDLGVLQVTLIVRPSASAHVDLLRLTGVSVGATVGTIDVTGVTLPYEALGLTVSDLGVETIDIPAIGVN